MIGCADPRIGQGGAREVPGARQAENAGARLGEEGDFGKLAAEGRVAGRNRGFDDTVFIRCGCGTRRKAEFRSAPGG